jgi:hypothetical protein
VRNRNVCGRLGPRSTTAGHSMPDLRPAASPLGVTDWVTTQSGEVTFKAPWVTRLAGRVSKIAGGYRSVCFMHLIAIAYDFVSDDVAPANPRL